MCCRAFLAGVGLLAVFSLEAQSLDSTWRVQVAGRSARVNPDGTFTILNIGIPPQFAPANPNALPLPYYARLIGFKTFGQQLRYVHSKPLKITPGETVQIEAGQLIFSDTLPAVVTTLSLTANPDRLSTIGATTQLQTTAFLAGGRLQDVTASASRTVYRSSNPAVASVSADGLVTGRSAGWVHLSAFHEGITASTAIEVGIPAAARTIVGFVFNPEGQPITGALVHIPGTATTAATDANGRYQIPNVPSSLSRPAVRVLSSPAAPLFGQVSSLDTSLAIVDGGILTARTMAQIHHLPCSDADQDCLPEEVEITLGLDPNSRDSDGDGIPDGVEDLDGDRLPNRFELLLGSLPQNADSDGDGIDDGTEVLQYRSVPYLADSDGDGIPDGVQDQDNDGLLDIAEDNNGNYIVDAGETNPRQADSDGDGVLDTQELIDGTSPTNEYAFEPRALSRFAFDTAAFSGEQGQEPLLNNAGTPVSSFHSRAGSAYRAHNGSQLLYRVVEPDNRINLNLLRGTVRFSFKPNNWSSGQPSHPFGSRLLEVGQFSPNGQENDGWWGLFLNQDRTKLSFGSQGPNSTTWERYIEADNLQFKVGQWYEVELTYGPRITYPYGRKDPQREQQYSNAYLYINGRRAGFGLGVNPNLLPNETAIAGGFALGSQTDGALNADITIDELHTYNYPLHSWNEKILTDRNWCAQANRANNTIILKRNSAINVHPSLPVKIFRRPFGSTNWGRPLVADYRETAFEDQTAKPGRAYEYRIWDTGEPDNSIVLQQHLTAAIDLPPSHERGKVILMIENAAAPLLNTEIAAFQTNLVGDGWEVVSHLVPRQNDSDFEQNAQSIAGIKTLIDRETDPNRTNVVILLGHVPVPMSGISAADGHSNHSPPDHRGAWAADGFYGSTNQNFWTDIGPTSIVNRDNPKNSNVPGDGKFDQNWLPQPYGSAVGRIDFAQMPAFTNASFLPGFPRHTIRSAEIALLRQYLDKNRRYRLGELTFKERFSGFRGFGQARDSATSFYNALNLSASLFGITDDRFINMRPLPQRVAYLFGFHEMNAFSTGIILGWEYRNAARTYSHTSEDLVVPENEAAIGFHLAYGSYFGDWNLNSNNWLKSLLAMPNSGLAALYYFPNKWRLEKLGLGAPLAVGMQEFNDPTKYESHRLSSNGAILSSYRPDFAPPRMLSILGDPTLRIHILPPPANLQAVAQGEQIMLTWEPPPVNGVHYYIHRSTNGIHGRFVPLTDTTPTPNWLDTTPPPGPKLYRIRAGKTQESGSGSYTNLSQGTFIAVK